MISFFVFKALNTVLGDSAVCAVVILICSRSSPRRINEVWCRGVVLNQKQQTIKAIIIQTLTSQWPSNRPEQIDTWAEISPSLCSGRFTYTPQHTHTRAHTQVEFLSKSPAYKHWHPEDVRMWYQRNKQSRRDIIQVWTGNMMHRSTKTYTNTDWRTHKHMYRHTAAPQDLNSTPWTERRTKTPVFVFRHDR